MDRSGNDGSSASSDRPGEPREPELPGEDNPGERLIRKYDPTIDAQDSREDATNSDTAEAAVPQETARLFWYLVAVFNVALLGIAVGAMLIGFQNRWTLGGQITLAGALLFVYGVYRYRKHASSAGGANGESDGTDDQNR